MTFPRPVTILPTGPVWKLEDTQWQSLRLRLLRYFAWVDSGRLVDPWEPFPSGVHHGSRLNANPVKSSRHEGYDAGKAAPLHEPDPTLVETDTQMLALPDEDKRLSRWHVHEGLTIDQCADRFRVSADTVQERWRRLGVRLFYRLP
jgi:hypothetical protein